MSSHQPDQFITLNGANLPFFGQETTLSSQFVLYHHPERSKLHALLARATALTGVKFGQVCIAQKPIPTMSVSPHHRFTAGTLEAIPQHGHHALDITPLQTQQPSRILVWTLFHEIGHVRLGHKADLPYPKMHQQEFEADAFAAAYCPALWGQKHGEHIIQNYPRMAGESSTHPSCQTRIQFLKLFEASQQHAEYQPPFLSTTLGTGQVTLFRDYEPVSVEALQQAAVALARAQAAAFQAQQHLPAKKIVLPNVFKFLSAELAKRGAPLQALPAQPACEL